MSTAVLVAGSEDLLSRRRTRRAASSLIDAVAALRDDPSGDSNGRRGFGKSPVGLLGWSELPFWQQHGSEFILTGYRKASGSARECLASWFYLHNESVNIHSHTLGTILFLALPFYVFATEVPPRYAVASREDVLVCCTYFLGVAVCFALSTAFHTFISHSPSAYRLGMTLDVQGVLLLMWSSTVPLIHYSFAPALVHRRDGGGGGGGGGGAGRTAENEFKHVRDAYLAASSVLAAACSATTLSPRMSGQDAGLHRAVLFGCFGAGSFLLPVAHGFALRGGGGGGGGGSGGGDGWAEHRDRIGLGWVLLTAACNAAGFVAYALRFPERWFPRRFDLVGASHQLMHVMVVAAALSYAVAVVRAFDARHFGGR